MATSIRRNLPFAGYHHHRASACRRIPVHPGCRGIPTTDHQSLHCYRAYSIQLLLLFYIPTAVTTGPILVAIQETQRHPTIQGQVCRITTISCPRLTTLFNLQSGCQSRSSSWRRPYSVSSATSRPHNLPDLIFSLNHSIGCAIPPPCQSRR